MCLQGSHALKSNNLVPNFVKFIEQKFLEKNIYIFIYLFFIAALDFNS